MSSAGENVKVLSLWASIFGMRVLIALKERGVEYEYQEEDVLDNKSQLLLQSNPIYKTIPVLIHNGKPICESLIIVQYIDEAWPSTQGNEFLPRDPYMRAMARFWSDFVDKKVFDAFQLILRNPQGELMEQGKSDLTNCLKLLDEALCDVFGGGPFFGGHHISLLDIALATHLPYFEVFETLGTFVVLEEGKCPHLWAWAKTVREHDSVKETLSLAPVPKLLECAHIFRKRLWGLES